ncbi:glycosyltransferase [Demequina gelatinilytica]|uniref:glycosyltransferase n=1 Tax=Demequina gelatinilytica TaxID=1638980 RepID=UPI0007824796|nr:glycosyltransferase [Demequina gelatinilytica]
MRVLVLGNHPDDGWSMRRYGPLLAAAYRHAGADVRLVEPARLVSHRLRRGPLRKLAVYVECLVAFPPIAFGCTGDTDVVHLADHSNALWLLGPLARRRTVVTCHDLVAVRAALGELEEHRARASGRLYQGAVRRGLARADLVECVSAATEGDVRRLVRPRATQVLHNPVSPELGRLASAASTASTASHEPAPGPGYALIVSTVGWRKRRDHAIRVWQRLRADGVLAGLGLRLVGPALTPEERALLDDEERAAVVAVTDVSDAALSHEYAGASVLIQASRHEGFGWPILEANAHGTPALCADLPVFREVAGTAGTFVGDDLDAVDWPAVAAHLTGDAARARARGNAARFDYEGFADALVRHATAVAGAGAPATPGTLRT